MKPDRIAAFLDAAEAAGVELHSFIVHQNGETTFESYWWPHTRQTLHATHSSTKSFTGVAVGLAIDDGKLGLDDRVLDFYPEFEPIGDSTNLELLTVRDLLTMRTGHEVTPSGAEWRLLTTSWVNAFLSAEVGRRPGEQFSYSSATAHMLSAIVQRVVGEPISEYLRPRFFEPLGIERSTWDSDPEGISSGGNGLSLTAPDFLKWGLVHLDGGRWQGKQVVPEWWVRESTRAQVEPITNPAFDGRVYRPGTETDPLRVAYGYQVWRGPQNSYYTLGLFGQICMVLPDRDLVLVFTAATASTRLLPLIYEVLLAPSAGAVPSPSFASLRERAHATEQEPLLTTSAQQLPATVYDADANAEGLSSIGVEGRDDAVHLTLADSRGEHRVTAGLGRWLSGRTGMTTTLLHHSYQDDAALIEAGARWIDERTLTVEIVFVETPFHETITLEFDRDKLCWNHSVNVNSGPTELPEVTARIRR
jgi:CubicO group peptidase (beta-lactamase class C family)